MIECPVCRYSNDDLSLKCSSCGSFIQDKVPTIDLFSMIWLVIESPKQAFKKIVLSEQKNFVLLQSLFFGISTAFAVMWMAKSGNNYDNLLPLLLHGIFFGLLAGVPFFLFIALSVHFFIKVFGGKGKWNETYAVVGWSLMPIVLATVFILPLELGILGLYFFSSNPNGFEYKPAVYVALIGFDALAVIWSVVLSSIGISIAHHFRMLKSLMMTLVPSGIVFYLIFYFYSLFQL